MNLHSPRRRIDWPYWLCVALFVATLLLVMSYGATHAQAGQPIRRMRKENRILVLKPVRAQGRARAGYPMAQTLKYTAGTAFRVSGLLNPLTWILR